MIGCLRLYRHKISFALGEVSNMPWDMTVYGTGRDVFDVRRGGLVGWGGGGGFGGGWGLVGRGKGVLQ